MVDPTDPSERTRYRATIQVNPSPVLSTDGTKVAGLRSSNVSGDGEPLVLGSVPTDGTRVVMTELSGVKGFQVYGWQDDTHVMGIFASKPTVESLNVETGETTQAVNLSDTLGGALLATDSARLTDPRRSRAAGSSQPLEPHRRALVLPQDSDCGSGGDVSGFDATRDDFEEFVAARMSSLLRTAYLLTGDHHDAQDLVQVALIKSMPHWRRISGAPDAYVRRVMVNENISRWRRRRWREVPTDALPETAAADDPEDQSALRTALQRLAPRQRAVIVLRYFEELTEAETAAAARH